MTSVFASRRRAEEFDSLVEAPDTGAPRDARYDDFLAIVESLRAVPDAEPRPEFVTSLRAELMSAADTALVATASEDRLSLSTRNPRRDRRIAVAIGGLAIVGAGTSMAVAAQSALPGEMLYPLKRAIESAETGVASTPDAKARTLLDSATSRLSEVQALGRGGDLADESAAVSTNFVDFGDQATQAADYILDDYAETGDRDLIRELRDFTGSSMDTLQALEDQVPSSARDELLAAVEVVSDIDTRAQRACPTCGGQGVDQIPSVLLASAASDAPVVVIPGATVESWEPRRRGDRDADGGGSGDGSLTGSLLGDASGGTSGGTSDGTGGSTGPLEDLTEGLTGDDPTASNGGGGDLTGTVEDTVKDVDKTVKDTEKTVKDTVDEIGDSLLGD